MTDETLTEMGERILTHVLGLLRMLSHEEWQTLYYQAMRDGSVHPSDVAIFEKARLLALAGGPTFKGGLEYSNPELAAQLASRR